MAREILNKENMELREKTKEDMRCHHTSCMFFQQFKFASSTGETAPSSSIFEVYIAPRVLAQTLMTDPRTDYPGGFLPVEDIRAPSMEQTAVSWHPVSFS